MGAANSFIDQTWSLRTRSLDQSFRCMRLFFLLSGFSVKQFRFTLPGVKAPMVWDAR